MSHLIFLTKKVGRNQNQGETSQGEMSQGEMSVREKCLLAISKYYLQDSKARSHFSNDESGYRHVERLIGMCYFSKNGLFHGFSQNI